MDNQKNTQKSSKLNELVDTALDSLHGLVDGNTVLGDPIITPSGTTVIPVSKVSMGVASGGVDYESKKTAGNNNFGGGGGSGVSVVPVAFLVVHADGSVELMNVSNPTSKPADVGYNVSSLLERAPEIIEKIKAMIPKKKAKNGAESESAETSAAQTETTDEGDAEQDEHEFLDTSL